MKQRGQHKIFKKELNKDMENLRKKKNRTPGNKKSL
jgi:hypothetical protein